MDHEYTDPVAKLLPLGEADFRSWRSYSGMGISAADTAELTRLAADRRFDDAEGARPEVYAPVHAWRALAEMRAPEAITVLIDRLDEFDQEHFDDYVVEDFSQGAAMIGPPALPSILAYLDRPNRYGPNQWTAADGAVAIAKGYPEVAEQVVSRLSTHLAAWPTNSPEFNSGLISSLVKLGARDTMPLIRAAMEADAVDRSITGSVEYVEYDLGLRETPPERPMPADKVLPGPVRDDDLPRPRTESDSRAKANAKERARSRRKLAKAAKKRNRKR